MQMKRRVGSEMDNQVYETYPTKEGNGKGKTLSTMPSFKYNNDYYNWEQFQEKAILFAKALHKLGI